MTRASRKYFIFVSQTTMDSDAGSRQDASPAAILADGEWQPVAAQAGAVVLPPVVVQVPLSGSTESTIQATN